MSAKAGTEIMDVVFPSVNLPTPILEVIDKSLARVLNKRLAGLVEDTNRSIELGVKTDGTARDANSIVEDGRKAIKVVSEVRLKFTRPMDAAKKELMEDVERLLSPLNEANKKLDGMVMERATRIRREEEARQREFLARKRAAEEEARKERERRAKISIAMGGTGEVAPVEPEKIEQPVELAGMRQTARLKSIVDKVKIESAVADGVRAIPGVHIYPVWAFNVVKADEVPKEYRKDTRA